MKEKLSFPLVPKPSSSTTEKPKFPNNFTHEDSDIDDSSPTNTEFITEFNSTETLTPHPNLIIPPLQNTWKPSSTDSSTSYGLNLRSKKVINTDSSNDSYESLDWKLLQKLREDIKILPEDKGLEEFVDVPVKNYGKAVLAGYGWEEGKGVGKNAKEDVKVVRYEGRIGRHGLGFNPQSD